MMLLYITIIWFVGVLVARWQLKYWFKDRIMLSGDYDELMFFSVLSWAIYPIYFFEWLIDKIKDK